MHRYLLPLVGLALSVAVGVVVLAATWLGGDDPPGIAEAPSHEQIAAVAAELGPIEVHRSESCGCCGGHLDHLAEAGFDIDDRTHADDAVVPAMKADLGIPEELWSCHTTIVDGYAVEGHVPAEVIVTLVLSGWDVDGVALPGMPGGSPGMAGEQDEPWRFVTFTGGVAGEVLTER